MRKTEIPKNEPKEFRKLPCQKPTIFLAHGRVGPGYRTIHTVQMQRYYPRGSQALTRVNAAIVAALLQAEESERTRAILKSFVSYRDPGDVGTFANFPTHRFFAGIAYTKDPTQRAIVLDIPLSFAIPGYDHNAIALDSCEFLYQSLKAWGRLDKPLATLQQPNLKSAVLFLSVLFTAYQWNVLDKCK